MARELIGEDLESALEVAILKLGENLESALADALRKLEDEAENECKAGAAGDKYWPAIITGSLKGDPSMIPNVATLIQMHLLGLEPMNRELYAIEKLWLFEILCRVQGTKAANLLCGKHGPGTNKNGQRAMNVALAVRMEITDHGATSVRAACLAVADKVHLDVETVRKYWNAWKPTINGRALQARLTAKMKENRIAGKSSESKKKVLK